VQTRKYGDTDADRAGAIRFATLDSTVALSSALFINSAILIVAAATFHGTGYEHIADINDAYVMLAPLLGDLVHGTTVNRVRHELEVPVLLLKAKA
jgi:manganese transport protein